jgi:type I restriction enzyme S subunit
MKVAMEVLESGFKETEIGLIPEDWEVVRLGEVVEKIKAGGTPKRSEKRFWGGSIPFILIEDLTKNNLYIKDAREYITEEGLEKSNAWIVPANSLLLSMYATIGETAINLIPVATNQAILGIIPKRDRLDVEFGAYLLKFHSKRLLSQNIQTTQKNVNKGIVENFLIPLPPLEEQKAIANILSTVQNAIEKTEKIINATKQLKKSMMKHLFTYGAVAVDEIDKVKLKETEIGLIPEDWEVVRLGEVFDVRQGKQLSSKESKEGKTLKPFLRTSNILWNRIDISNLSQMPFSDKEFEALKLCKGDILVCEGGDVGRTAVWEGQLEECAYQNHLHRLRPKGNNIVNYFFSYWMEYAISLRGLYINIANKTTIPNLSSQRLKSFLIPLPPLEEQQKIAQILTAIDQKIQAEEKKKEALQNLFKTLLHHLMTGKIRVKKTKT